MAFSLIYDHPYLFYWGKGISAGYSYSYYQADTIASFYFRFPVDTPYADLSTAADQHGQRYSVDKNKTSAALSARENALAIVQEAAGLDDEAKLLYYARSIAGLNTYNSEAAQPSWSGTRDPWKIVWVFDNDPATNVVCEGYSKAFKFLCDNSTFRGSVVCDDVTGFLNGGAHMWNIIHMNGTNYLVDVTNFDQGEQEWSALFMNAQPDSGSVEEGYFFDKVSYIYDPDTLAMYPLSVLTIGTPEVDPDAQTITYDDRTGTITLTLDASGKVVSGTHVFPDGSSMVTEILSDFVYSAD